MRPTILVLGAIAGCSGGDKAGTDSAYIEDFSAPLLLPEVPPETEPLDCVADAPVSLWMSPDDSNSMSSPVQAREAALAGHLGGVSIRRWEFLNYYTFGYAPADPGTLRVELDLVEGAAEGEYTMQIGVASPPPDEAPVNLALVIDDSGSMSGDPIQRAADVGRAIASQLRAGDHVSVVTWSDDQTIVLEAHEASGPDDPVVVGAIGSLRADGGTNLSKGLATGYQLLERHFAEDRINRLVLISDGGANIGQTDADVIGAHAGDEDEAGIYLVGVGVGTPGDYNDHLMDTVTDLGKGASVFVPDQAEAERMFRDRFASTMGVAARDVHIRLDLPPGFELVRTTAEEVSTDPDEVRPQHVSPGDAMVLHQTLASSCGEAPPETTFGVTVTWLDPVTFEPHETSVVATLGELLAQDHHLLRKGQAIVAYVDALEDQSALEVADAELAEALALAPEDPDLLEIREVLDAL